MQYTTNYGLTKLELSDSPADITEINDNWETIDEKLKEHADMLDGTTGSIAFTDKQNSFSKTQNFLRSFNFKDTGSEFGITPTSNRYIRIDFKDKNNIPFAYIQMTRRTSGRRDLALRLIKEEGDGQKASSIELVESYDGTVFGLAPTPKASSDTNEIATTKWVRDRIPELAPEPDLSDYVKSVNNVTPDISGNVTLDMPDDNSIKQLVLNTFFPVGSIYMDATGKINPNTQFGGTWVKIENRFLYGQGTKNIGATGGAETVVLSLAQMPSHSHDRGNMNITGNIEFHSGYSRGGSGALYYVDRSPTAVGGGGTMTGTNLHIDAGRNWNGNTGSQGSNSAHENMPPYLVVAIWKRTA